MLSSKTAKALIGGAALAVLLPAGALAQDQQPNAQQAMQGGGMTEERQLDEQLKEYQATIDATEQAVNARAIIAERRMAIA